MESRPRRHGRSLLDFCRTEDVVDGLGGTRQDIFDTGLRAIEKRCLLFGGDGRFVNGIGRLLTIGRGSAGGCQQRDGY